MRAHWPEVPEADNLILKESEYFTATLHEFRVRLKKMNEKVCHVRPSLVHLLTACLYV